MSVAYSYKDIEYSLKKSDRKTTSIYIERDGAVSILAPAPFELDKIERIIEKKRSWIYRSLAEWEDLNRTRVQREYVNGESFLYLGRNYQLRISDNQNEPLKLMNGKFSIRYDHIHKGREIFKAFYKQKAEKKIPDRIKLYAPKMGVSPNNIRVMELQGRWASCTSNGDLNFNWKCSMASLKSLDYIVVHELAHLKVLDHSPAFWHIVEKVMPDYQERIGWLKRFGASLEL